MVKEHPVFLVLDSTKQQTIHSTGKDESKELINLFTKKRMSGDYTAEAAAAANHLTELFSPRGRKQQGTPSKKKEGGEGSGSEDDMAPMMVDIEDMEEGASQDSSRKTEESSEASDAKMVSSGEGECEGEGEGEEQDGATSEKEDGKMIDVEEGEGDIPEGGTPRNHAEGVPPKGNATPRNNKPAAPIIATPPPAPMLNLPSSLQSPREDPFRLVTPRTAGLIQSLNNTSVCF